MNIGKGKKNANENVCSEFEGLYGAIIFIDIKNKKVSLRGNLKSIFDIKCNNLNISIDEFCDYIHENHVEKFLCLFNECNLAKKDFKLHLKSPCLEMDNWIKIHLNKVIVEEEVIGYEGYVSKVIDSNEDEVAPLENTPYLDEVTGLHKRIYLKDKIDFYLGINKNSNKKSALIILGLDNFKYINDTFGVTYGDKYLKSVARELKNKIISDDYICRLEGDEFLIFLHNATTLTEIETKAQSIIDVFNKSYNIEGKQVHVTTSIGIAIYPDDGYRFDELIKNADAAMYEAKTKGKNQYQFFNDSIAQAMDRAYKIQNNLMSAIENEEMYVVFQPKVILAHERVNGFEALIRWNNKEIGNVPPNEFIPVAENNGMIVHLGNFVLREVFKKVDLLLKSGYSNFKIAVNLSDVQLRNQKLITYVKYLCDIYKIDGRYIEFEITEGILIKSYEDTLRSLYELKKLGSTIALDDFGTGYSSLNYLTKLPIDALKIDRSFVIDMIENHKSRWIVENIIQLSHKLGIEVVAEGVELEEQVDYLKSILCDIVQGYFYSKPESFEKVVNLLEK